jgi:hypothetical protein
MDQSSAERQRRPGAIGGAVAEISDAKVRDLSQLCEEFKFIEHAKTVGNWQAEQPVIRGKLDLVRTALEERFGWQARTMLMLDQALHQEREAAMGDAEKLSAMEAEVSGLRSLLRETAAPVQKAARDIDLSRAAAAEQRLVYGREIWALEEEMGTAREVIAAIGRSLGQREGEWKAAIGGLHRKATQERRAVSSLEEVLGCLDGKHKRLRETVARQGDADVPRHVEVEALALDRRLRGPGDNGRPIERRRRTRCHGSWLWRWEPAENPWRRNSVQDRTAEDEAEDRTIDREGHRVGDRMGHRRRRAPECRPWQNQSRMTRRRRR